MTVIGEIVGALSILRFLGDLWKWLRGKRAAPTTPSTRQTFGAGSNAQGAVTSGSGTAQTQAGSGNIQARDITGPVAIIRGAIVDDAGTARTLKETAVELGQLQVHNERLTQENEQLRAQRDEAVRAAQDLSRSNNPPPGIEEALKHLKAGDSAQAEAIFATIAADKKAEGKQAYKEAAAALRHLGALAYEQDTPKALSAYEESVTLDPDDPYGWNMLGLLHQRVGAYDGAIEALERGRVLGDATSDKAAVAMALGNLGNVHAGRGDLAKAKEFYLNALKLNEELGRTEGMAAAYVNLGNINILSGDLAKAEEFQLKALGLDKEPERKQAIAAGYDSLGIIYGIRGDLAKAEEFLVKALNLGKALGRKEGMANTHNNLGVVYQRRGDTRRACENWTTARAFFVEIGMTQNAERVARLMREAGCAGV